MSEPTQNLTFPQDVSITRCCASCIYGKEYYGCEWFCGNNKYKREVLGKVLIQEKGTQPYFICKDYEMEEYLRREINES